MPSTAYFDRVSSPGAWSREEKPEGSRLQCLNGKSASKWGRDQLVALRVYVTGKKKQILLPVLEGQHGFLSGFRFDKEPVSPDPDFWGEAGGGASIQALSDLVTGPSSHEKITQSVYSEYALCNAYGRSLGGVWAALNRLCVGSGEDESTDKPLQGDGSEQGGETSSVSTLTSPSPSIARELAEEGHRGGEMHSSSASAVVEGSPPRIIAGLKRAASEPPEEEPGAKRQARSSPGEGPSSEEPASDPGEASETSGGGTSTSTRLGSEEGDSSSDRPEDLTHHFLAEFLRHTLINLPQGNWSTSLVVDFDELKLSLDCTIGDNACTYTSIDDGGLTLMFHQHSRTHRLGRMAIIETKRALGKIVEGRPVFSDERLAQIVAEALSVRMETQGKWSTSKEVIPVIAGARYFVRFFQVEISEEYVHQLEQGHDTATEYIKVQATKWFDLRDPRARNKAMGNIAGIIRLVLSEG